LFFAPLFKPSIKRDIAVIIIKPKVDRQRNSHIIGRYERRIVIAPHMADMGNARNMPKINNAKTFTIGMVILNIALLAAARTK
jgi:hypothetical protein